MHLGFAIEREKLARDPSHHRRVINGAFFALIGARETLQRIILASIVIRRMTPLGRMMLYSFVKR
jgi:hypothetical protein